MSESVVEPDAGGTGEVVAQDSDTSAEDQAAEEALHQLVQDDPDELKRQIEHWRKTAQRNDRTARDNSAAAKRLRELEEASKTDLQKAVDAQRTAELERDALRAEHTRATVAAAHDLDPELSDFLGDGTEEDITARADQLSEIINRAATKLAAEMQQNGGRPPGGARPGRPVESMRPGAAPAGSGATDANDMFRKLLTGDRD
jgi:gas vesicle protein